MAREHGISLIEISVVIAILGLIAIIVLPTLSSTRISQLEQATDKVADALRFARSEAMRTGSLRGVVIDAGNTLGHVKDIAVFEPGPANGSIAVDSLVQHPMWRHEYDLWLDDRQSGQRVEFAAMSPPFAYEGLEHGCNLVVFNARGMPVYPRSGVQHRLIGADVELRLAGQIRRVDIAQASGQITVQ